MIPFEDLLFINVILILIFCVCLIIKNTRLKKALKEAEYVSRAKSDFVASISHEVRAPMNAILSYSDLIGNTALESQQKSYVNSIQSSAQLMMAIINDGLDFTNLDSSQTKIQDMDFDLEHLIYDIFKISEVRYKKTHINTYIDWDEPLPRWVKGDPTRLRQVILNLLGNASQFTQRGEIGLIVKLVPSRDPQSAMVSFTVKDSGVGIEPAEQQKLKILFKQTHEAAPLKYEGNHVGLSICKRMVNAMGGTMSFYSKLGEGSEFHFTITFQKGVSLIEQHIQPLSKDSLFGKKVVLIDSHTASLQILQRHCREIGLNIVASANNGPAALDAINRLYQTGILPDLILSDVIIPGINGYDFARKIRMINAFKSMRMIALTSDVRVGAAQQAQNQGFDGFLPKPVSRGDLMNIIATVLGDKRPSNAAIVTRHVVKEVALKGLKVLVVEDNVANIHLLKSYLDSFGCLTDYAHNGQEAIEKIPNDSYDLCLMDLEMPFLSGEEAAKKIRELGLTKLTIVALIERSTDEERVIHAGMNDYILKPVQMKDLKEKLNYWAKQF